MGKAIIFFLIFCLLSSIVIAQNFRYLYSPYTAKLDRTLSLNQSENDMQVSNITASNGTFENLLVKNPPVNCPVNTGMIYTNMTTSTCSNNITDWYRIGSNTVYTIGNVGIGTANPKHLLDVGGMEGIGAPGNLGIKSNSGALAIRIEENSGVEGWHIGVDADGDLNFDDSNTGIKITFQDETGRVGIGAVDPSKTLELRTGVPVIRLRDTGDTTTATTAFVEFGGTTASNWDRTGYIGDGSSGDTHIRVRAEDSDLYLGDSSGEQVLILSDGDATFSGNVGIGTIATNGKLWVKALSGQILDLRDAGDKSYLRARIDSAGVGEVVINEDSQDIDFRVESNNNANALFVRGSDGKVGIGTTTPTAKLNVIGAINATENITGNYIYGDISVHPDGNITVEIEIQNIHKNITGFDKTHLNGFKLVDNALVAEVDGEYKVDYWLSTAGGVNRIYESCIAVNGEHETPHAHRKQGAAGDIGSMSGGGVITLVAGDIVNLQIRNIDGTQDVDIFNAGMRLERLGDTFT